MSNQNDGGTVATAPVMAAAASDGAPNTNPAATNDAPANAPNEVKKRKVNPIVLIGVVAVLALVGVLYYLYTQTYQDTDDAQVDGHLDPIASRVDGTITAVHVDDNYIVKAGDPLVDLDPSDNKVSLAQAQAQYDQAMAQLGAAHPNVPITRTSNASDVTSSQADVANADAALAQAQA